MQADFLATSSMYRTTLPPFRSFLRIFASPWRGLEEENSKLLQYNYEFSQFILNISCALHPQTLVTWYPSYTHPEGSSASRMAMLERPGHLCLQTQQTESHLNKQITQVLSKTRVKGFNTSPSNSDECYLVLPFTNQIPPPPPSNHHYVPTICAS